MPVRKDPDGNRYVFAEVEVPGTPEDVWAAIATGPGISSWFVPTQLEEREGGQIKSNFGPGMDALATVKEWNPPEKMVAISPDDTGPGGPAIATEWIVEARDGGTCVVRVVHRWFTESDKWDQEFEGHTEGWKAFFRILRLYLAHFNGQPCSAFQVMGMSQLPKNDAWNQLVSRLGLAGLEAGQTFQTAPAAPGLGGRVERVGPVEHPEELLLVLDKPTSGVAHLFALPMMGAIYLSVRVFLYGEQSAQELPALQSQWQSWMQENFPMAPPNFDAAACQPTAQ